jgi:hypothetical protein
MGAYINKIAHILLYDKYKMLQMCLCKEKSSYVSFLYS